jgi:hypothetical protein
MTTDGLALIVPLRTIVRVADVNLGEILAGSVASAYLGLIRS